MMRSEGTNVGKVCDKHRVKEKPFRTGRAWGDMTYHTDSEKARSAPASEPAALRGLTWCQQAESV